FWQKYHERLDKSLEHMDEAIKAENKVGTAEETRKGYENYKKEFRQKSLIKRKTFGDLESVLQSYSIRNQSRASSNSHSRYIKIEAKLFGDKLTEIYYQFVRGIKTSDYGK